jgi:hypothetical protein
LLEVLRPYGVLEMVRTGIVAMRRGKKSGAPAGATNGATRGATNGAAQLAADDDASQSV